jgi:integrase
MTDTDASSAVLAGRLDIDEVLATVAQDPEALTRRRPGEVLHHDEVLALMAACSRRAPTGVRNRALIAVGWRAGLRLAELLALIPGDIDARHGVVLVRNGKGAVSRRVGIDDQALERVEHWRERRGRLALPRDAPLFCTLQGGALDQAYVRRMLRRLAAKPTRPAREGERPQDVPRVVERRVHPHALRHTLAHELYREGFTLQDIQQQLGHAHARTTWVYLQRIAPDVVPRIRRRRWDEPDAPARRSTSAQSERMIR